MMAALVCRHDGQNIPMVACEAVPLVGGKVTRTFNFGRFAEHFDPRTERIKTPDPSAELKQAVGAIFEGLNSPDLWPAKLKLQSEV